MNIKLRHFVYVILFLLPAVSGYAQQMIGYLNIREIKGASEDGSIELLGFAHQVYVPYSAEEGRINGSPVVTAITLSKYIDETTPAILNAYYTAQRLPEATISLLRINPDTRLAEPDHVLRLENVIINAITNQRDENSDRNIEVIDLTAERITLTNVTKNIEYQIDNRPRTAKPQVYNPNIGKVYFYDEGGTLIEGSEIKVPYSSRMSDFQISSYIMLDIQGRPSGRTINEAYILQKEIDAVSLKLIEYLFEAKPLSKITIALEHFSIEGGVEEYMWYDFEDVHLISDAARTLTFEDINKGNFPFTETVAFIARRVSWRHISGESGSSENPNYAEFISGPIPDMPVSVQINNYPNPFNGQTRIEYNLPVETKSGPMQIAIYDIGGRLINTLFNGFPTTEKGFVTWDGTDLNRKTVSSGSYFYLVKAGQEVKTGKILHIK